MKRKTELLLLLSITVIGFIFRFYALADAPQALARDEVSAAYNAYSLIKTGQDEHGVFLPLAFKAFGDWKLPVEIYLEIPGILLFGLNAFSTRLPEALLGTATVPLLYLTLRQVFRKISIPVALAAAFFLAISPWHVFMSRVAFGYNVLGLFFFLLGVYFFFRFLQEKKLTFLFASNFGFIMTLFSYTAFHIFTPLFLVGLYLLYRKSIPLTKAILLQLGIFILCYGIVSMTLLEANVQKIEGTSLWHYNDYYQSYIWEKRQAYDDPMIARIMQNKPMIFLNRVVGNYILTYSPEFLVTEGGVNKVNNLEGMGNMYMAEYVFFLLGAGFFLYKREKGLPFLLLWLAVGAVPAILTREAPHSTRNLLLVPMLSLLAGYGFITAVSIVRQSKGLMKWVGAVAVLGLVGFGVLNIISFADNYLHHLIRDRGLYWNAGYKEVVAFVNEKNPGKVVMDGQSLSPYNYFLFYNRYDPAQFHREVQYAPPTWDNFQHIDSFGKYHFVEEIALKDDLKEENVLYILRKEKIPQSYPVSGYISDPTGRYEYGWVYTDKTYCTHQFPGNIIPVYCRQNSEI